MSEEKTEDLKEGFISGALLCDIVSDRLSANQRAGSSNAVRDAFEQLLYCSVMIAIEVGMNKADFLKVAGASFEMILENGEKKEEDGVEREMLN